jgi:acetate kinase
MPNDNRQSGLLTLNAGSSSIKFAIFLIPELDQIITGQIDGIGSSASFKAKNNDHSIDEKYVWPDTSAPKNHHQALQWLIQWLNEHLSSLEIQAVGHRVVHGGQYYTEPVLIDDDVLQRLESLLALAPLHEPHNVEGIKAAKETFGDIPQVACFDTAFHRTQPFINDTYALPRHYYEEGVRRYGFHGLSYEYIQQHMEKHYPTLNQGKVIVLHLGNGASMCAIKGGQAIASTMGFSALDGLAMGTRCGQIDPGVLLYLLDFKGLTGKELSDLLYKESGLKGLSGISNDMRTLEASDSAAASEAITYFVSRITREIGSLAMALGGLDALVFTGGIGENSVRIRHDVLHSCAWLGIEIDWSRNENTQTILSTENSKITCLRIPTNEERMIAEHTLQLSQLSILGAKAQ